MAIVPEGKVIRSLRGGPDVLRGLLRELKRYSFTGYVLTRRPQVGSAAEGVLGVKAGEVLFALRSIGSDASNAGDALKQMWFDSRFADCAIQLHAKVDVDAIAQEHPDAVVERARRVAKRPKPVAAAAAGVRPEDQIRKWKAAGYQTKELEASLGATPQEARTAIDRFAEGVRRSVALEERLDRLDPAGMEDRIAAIRGKLRDLRRLTVTEAEIADLQAEQEAAREAGHRGTEGAHPGGVADRARRVFEMIVKPPPGTAASDAARQVVIRGTEEAAPPRDERTNLIRWYTFETFVVGASNRFAHAAATAVAKSPKTAYNPLFMTSGSGLGKTHLINAIGNAVVSMRPEARVVYLSAEVFANEFRQAKTSGALPEFRAKHRSLDLFLLDDVHFLSGQGDVQEELFHTFNELTGAGKQIALTSDRPPKEIPELEDRLVSRFESGLIADIQVPELETRIAILRRRAADSGLVPDEVLKFIAEAVPTNVRELGGALNRVTAHASLLGQPVTIALARQVLKDASAARPRAPKAGDGDRDLQPGRSYLIEEPRPAACFRLFSRLTAVDGGLLITRTNPKRLRDKVDVGKASVLWLTDREAASERTIAPQLERIMYEMGAYLEAHHRGPILIDGIEFLVSSAGFDAVLKFLRHLVDTVSESQVVLLISLCAETLQAQEVKTLEREMDVLAYP